MIATKDSMVQRIFKVSAFLNLLKPLIICDVANLSLSARKKLFSTRVRVRPS